MHELIDGLPAGDGRRAASRPALLVALASPHTMVAVFVLTGAGALAVAYDRVAATAAMTPPLALLATSLAAAIAVRPRLRADAPLLLFHVALLVLVGLFAAARLTYFDGGTTLSSDTTFDGELLQDDRGPWHRDRLAELRFANEGFAENYPRRGDYLATYNRVRWWDANGGEHVAEIGDDRPLLLAGYRIYPSRQRGFSPVFHWRTTAGDEDYGTVQMNDAGPDGFGAANRWEIPGGPAAWAMLDVREAAGPAPGTQRVDLGTGALQHRLVVRVGGERHEMRPGDRLELAEGVLTYLRLDSWMSYRITYDPTKPWLVSTVLVAVGSLMWFYARRFRERALGK